MILRYDGTTKIAEVTGVGEGSITSAKLADNSVTTTKVVDGSITTAKLANRAVTSEKIDWTTIKGAPTLRNIAVSDDTPKGWKSVMEGLSGQEAGRATIWYTEPYKFSTQPSQYGFCEVFWADGSDVALVWHEQACGDWFWRSGNAFGWSDAWRNGVNDLYFRPGETIDLTVQGFGYVTSSATGIDIAIPVGKSLAMVSTVTINSGGLDIRCDNNYAVHINENFRNYTTTLSCNKALGCLTKFIVKSGGFKVTNNSAVGIAGTLNVTFNA